MPKGRFARLDPERSAAILAVAAEEFARHGFTAASYNGIILRAGVSKGAMYYYFEDKADLYATVLQDALGRFMEWLGPFGPVDDADQFWERSRELYRRAIDYYDRDPTCAGLVRSVAQVVTSGESGVRLEEMLEFSRSWFTEVIHLGQRLGAVRSDLPHDLLVAVVIAVSEAFDLWLADNVGRLPAEQRDQLADKMVGLLRAMARPLEEQS